MAQPHVFKQLVKLMALALFAVPNLGCHFGRAECGNHAGYEARVTDERIKLAHGLLQKLSRREGSELARAEYELEISQLIPREDRWPFGAKEVECDHAEWAEKETFSQRPVVFSRALLARIRVLAQRRNWSTAELLVHLAELSPSDLTEYAMLPGEAGEPPPRELVRWLSLSALSRGWGTDVGEAYIVSAIKSSKDDRDIWVMEAPRRLIPGWSADDREDVRAAWVSDLPGRLARATSASPQCDARATSASPQCDARGPSPNNCTPTVADQISLEVAIHRLTMLDGLAFQPGAGEVRPLLTDVVQKKGHLPITMGIQGGARDLFYAALWALESHKNGFVEETRQLRFPSRKPADFPSNGKSKVLDPRPPLDPFRYWLSGEFLPLSPGADVRATLGSWKNTTAGGGADAQCFRYRRLARLGPTTQAETAFNETAKELFDEDHHLRNSAITACLLPTLAEWEAVPESKRASFFQTFVDGALEPTRFDAKSAPKREGWQMPAWPDAQLNAALVLLDERSEWVIRYPDLARRVLDGMLLPVRSQREPGVGPTIVQVDDNRDGVTEVEPPYAPLVPSLWNAMLALPDLAEPDLAERRAVLRNWIQRIPEVLKTPEIGWRTKERWAASSHDDVIVRVYLLAEYARRYDLVEPAQALFQWLTGKGAELAMQSDEPQGGVVRGGTRKTGVEEGGRANRAKRMQRHATLALSLLNDAE